MPDAVIVAVYPLPDRPTRTRRRALHCTPRSRHRAGELHVASGRHRPWSPWGPGSFIAADDAAGFRAIGDGPPRYCLPDRDRFG
jgi:hypothetical protein